MIVFESDPQTKAVGVQFLMNPDEYKNEVMLRFLMQGKSYKVIPDNDGPLLEFLQCYKFDEKQGFVLNQSAFNEHIYKHWRQLRSSKFQVLDTEYIIALERNDADKIADVVQRKTVLRDITTREIPAYNAIEESLKEYMLRMKSYIPKELI
jgi:hypothetical protein